jgi:hypothetical protein
MKALLTATTYAYKSNIDFDSARERPANELQLHANDVVDRVPAYRFDGVAGGDGEDIGA